MTEIATGTDTPTKSKSQIKRERAQQRAADMKTAPTVETKTMPVETPPAVSVPTVSVPTVVPSVQPAPIDPYAGLPKPTDHRAAYTSAAEPGTPYPSPAEYDPARCHLWDVIGYAEVDHDITTVRGKHTLCVQVVEPTVCVRSGALVGIAAGRTIQIVITPELISFAAHCLRLRNMPQPGTTDEETLQAWQSHRATHPEGELAFVLLKGRPDGSFDTPLVLGERDTRLVNAEIAAKG